MVDSAKLLRLQNGSDVRGVAMAMEGGGPVTLSAEVAEQIAGGYVAWLARRTGKQPDLLRIGVGHDSRLTAGVLKDAIAWGITFVGAQVLDCGLASTPAMFMGCALPATAFDGAIMITASHLPKNRNGMKFFTRDGGVDRQDVTDILTMHPLPKAAIPGIVQPRDLMSEYTATLRDKIVECTGVGGRPLEGLRIVVDAGNGAGGFFVKSVLEPLGADCAGSQFLEPDGEFPNHAPNPEDAAAMTSICEAVKAAGADLGVIFDTDVDRMSAVFSDGTPVNRNAIIALMGAVIAQQYPGGTIVTDSVTSDLLTEFLEGRLGLMHHRYKRGYRNVINEAQRLNAVGTLAPMAIETSGHGALMDNYFLDDGAYMAVRIVAAAAIAKRDGSRLENLLQGFHDPVAEDERRIKIIGEDFIEYGQRVLDVFAIRAEEQGMHLAHTYEGVRLTIPGKGWLLLRLSLHDPVLPLNVEGKKPENIRELLDLVTRLLDGFERLDVGALED